MFQMLYLANIENYFVFSTDHIFHYRRGYATERQKGLLIVEKLDYIQSKLLRGIFSIVSKPLGNFGNLIKEVTFFFFC